MIYVLGAMAAVAGAYQLIALLACIKHLTSRRIAAASSPGVSILKPVRGLDPGFEEAILSHTSQDYPEFELLLGYGCTRTAPNAKAGVLLDLIKEAHYPIIIVNDADIVAPPGYIREVTAPLADPAIGLVTCLYRAEGDTWPSRWEALGVATEFAPSALVAPLFGVSEFGFGSTLAFRRADLDSIGGFAAVADYLADDYQLGARIHQLGRRNLISRVVVRTRLNATSWGEAWRHQLRWARTIRVSRRGGYVGLPVTFASLWALAAAAAGLGWIALALIAVRLSMAITAGAFVVESRDALRYCWLIPFRDLYGVAVWAAGLFGDTVEWGGETLRLDSQGRILRSAGPPA